MMNEAYKSMSAAMIEMHNALNTFSVSIKPEDVHHEP